VNDVLPADDDDDVVAVSVALTEQNNGAGSSSLPPRGARGIFLKRFKPL
jgi:hypothetical protein